MSHGTETKRWEDGSISEVTNVIDLNEQDAPGKITEILEELVDRMKQGYHDFKIHKTNGIEAGIFVEKTVIEFRKLGEWKYLSIRFISKTK
jgi:uncharacterized protein YbcV (DUF1398 family)